MSSQRPESVAISTATEDSWQHHLGSEEVGLQVMLLVVESAHSGPAMRALNRYAQGLASALMSLLLTHERQGPPGMGSLPLPHRISWHCTLPCLREPGKLHCSPVLTSCTAPKLGSHLSTADEPLNELWCRPLQARWLRPSAWP